MEFFLHDRSELCGMNILEVISGADSNLLSAIVENLKDRKYALVSATCRRRDGSGFPAEIAISRVHWSKGDELCCTVRDLTVRKQAEKALKEALERLEERDRARLLLVSNVSHELRTPVTSMAYGIANVLKGTSGPVPDSLKPYLERFQRDCRRLLTTANEILDLSALESKTMKLSIIKMPVNRLVARSVELLDLNARQKGIELTMVLSPEPLFVRCDSPKMERVILNVIGNAVKYTPGGGRVEVEVRRHQEQYKAVSVIVTDTGIGIPPSAIDRVTERYYRVGTQADGAGLGLAISREIIEMHNGTLEITSPPAGRERGTRVELSLALTDPVSVVLATADDALAAQVKAPLDRWGFKVERVPGAAGVAGAAARARADLVMADLALATAGGTGAVSELSAVAEAAKLPLVALARAVPDGDVRDALRAKSIPLAGEMSNEIGLLDQVEGVLNTRVDLDTQGAVLPDSKRTTNEQTV